MMGNRSGRHALHCGVASRAHLIVLPFFRFPGPVLEEIASRRLATYVEGSGRGRTVGSTGP